MPPTYEQNKASIYRYRLNHLEKYRAMDRRNKNKAYGWQKIQKLYLKILL